MTTTRTLVERARELGGNSADSYAEEFNSSPAEDGTDGVGDWDSSAWSLHWHELRDAGATAADHDACLKAWREGFWGTSAVIWTEDDMIDAAVEWWADEDLDGHDCGVRRGVDASGEPCLVVLHKPTGRTSAEMGDGGRWHLDGTAYGS